MLYEYICCHRSKVGWSEQMYPQMARPISCAVIHVTFAYFIPGHDNGKLLRAIERPVLGQDIDRVLLGVRGDDCRVVLGSERRAGRPIEKNLNGELQHGVQLTLSDYLHWTKRTKASKPTVS